MLCQGPRDIKWQAHEELQQLLTRKHSILFIQFLDRMSNPRKSEVCEGEVSSSEVVNVKVNEKRLFLESLFSAIDILFRKCLMRLKET